MILFSSEKIDDVILNNVINIVFFCYRIINDFNICSQNVFKNLRFYLIRLELLFFEQFININILLENFVNVFIYYR